MSFLWSFAPNPTRAGVYLESGRKNSTCAENNPLCCVSERGRAMKKQEQVHKRTGFLKVAASSSFSGRITPMDADFKIKSWKRLWDIVFKNRLVLSGNDFVKTMHKREVEMR
jgi:hypothetical protein